MPLPSPLISVIVPIYNMEPLLPRCLDSLAAQTLRDLEIICVDDGSTDGSGGIVRKYASGDSRFRLITQENSGRAEARNAGIRAAAAPYLGFADPDDYVEPDMYERLYRLAEESGADMVQCSYSPFLPAESGESRGMAEEKLLHIENTACDGVFTEKGEIFRLFLEDRITGVVWSKLFRRILPGCSAPLDKVLASLDACRRVAFENIEDAARNGLHEKVFLFVGSFIGHDVFHYGSRNLPSAMNWAKF